MDGAYNEDEKNRTQTAREDEGRKQIKRYQLEKVNSGREKNCERNSIRYQYQQRKCFPRNHDKKNLTMKVWMLRKINYEELRNTFQYFLKNLFINTHT